ncbi:hypothetical protein ACWDNT_25395 [Streptomyces sp. NPDC000963]
MTAFEPSPLVPQRMFLTSGTGTHPWELRAQALMYLDAGIGSYNRVGVSTARSSGPTSSPRLRQRRLNASTPACPVRS